MKLNDIIRLANSNYPDGLISDYWDFANSKPRWNPDAGDTLAYFIALELKDTYNDKAATQFQLKEAMRVMASAVRQLTDVYNGFCIDIKKLNSILKKERELCPDAQEPDEENLLDAALTKVLGE